MRKEEVWKGAGKREIVFFNGSVGSCESENSGVLMTCRPSALPVAIEGNGFRKKAGRTVST